MTTGHGPSLAAEQASNDYENALLEYFAKKCAYPIREEKMKIGHFEYFNFSCFSETNTGLSGFGRSTSRRVAALKGVAEILERKFIEEFFEKRPEVTQARQIDLSSAAENIGPQSLPPMQLATSNGWAVHFSAAQSEKNSVAEALERHLLLKSFLSFGWDGFNLERIIESADMRLLFLTSRFRSQEKLAGLVIAKSPIYPGVSFGYCVGAERDLAEMSFWENAIFEAIDKIAMLKGQPIQLDQDRKSWIMREIKHFLESPFDLGNINAAKKPVVTDDVRDAFLQTFDLQRHWGLDFPFFASFAWGGHFIPLFSKDRLDAPAESYLAAILRRHGIFEIPARHPIL